jgi:hypothetical protein
MSQLLYWENAMEPEFNYLPDGVGYRVNEAGLFEFRITDPSKVDGHLMNVVLSDELSKEMSDFLGRNEGSLLHEAFYRAFGEGFKVLTGMIINTLRAQAAFPLAGMFVTSTFVHGLNGLADQIIQQLLIVNMLAKDTETKETETLRKLLGDSP